MTIGGQARDYQAVIADLMRMAPQLAPEWTYRGDDDFGVVLLQLASYLADHLHYRADATLRDCLPTRSPHVEVVREYAEWLGYLATRPAPAEVNVVIGVAAALGEDLPIPRGFKCSGTGPEGGVTFELTDEVVLLEGATSVAAVLTEGELQVDVLLGVATGAPGERFEIPDEDCIFNWGDDEIAVTVGGVAATHYRFPALLEPSVLGFWVRLNPSGLLELRFGDGSFGRSLPPGAQIRGEYRTGGGVRGNVGVGAVDTVVSPIALSDGTPVTLTVTNAEMASGGAAAEGVNSIRVNAPAAFRSQNRAVTHEDYVSHVLRVPGVYRARVMTRGVNGVRVFIVPTGVGEGERVTRALQALVVRALDPVRMCTDSVSAEAATLVKVDVTLAVRAKRSSRNGVVLEAVRQKFVGQETGIFWESRNDLGRTLWQSDMVNEIEDVAGVDNLDVLRYARRPELRWISTTGTAAISATGVATNVTTRAQTWYVEMVSATEFTVRGSISGLQSTLGELDVLFSDDAGEISFTLETGVLAQSEGDTAEIAVGELRGNVVLGDDEFPIFDSSSVSITVTGGIGA